MSPAAARLMVRRLESLTSSNGCSYFLFALVALCAPLPYGRCAGGFLNTSGRGVFFVGAPFGPRQVDAERLSGAERVFVEFPDLDLLAGRVHHADVEAQRLHFLDEH